MLEFSFAIDVPVSVSGDNYDYSYKQDQINFRISQVCLEAEYYDQIHLNKIVDKAVETWYKFLTKTFNYT